MKPNMTNNVNPQTQHTPSKSNSPLPEKKIDCTDPFGYKKELLAMIRSMSLQRAVNTLQLLHDVEQAVIDHLEELAYQHEDGDVSIYIPKGMVDAAGIAMGDPMDIEMSEDGLYISRARENHTPDAIDRLNAFFDFMEGRNEE